MSSAKSTITNNPFLQTYLEYVEDTESPRIFHIMSALAGVGACLGRRNWIQFGSNEIFANMYIALVGPPAAKKSSALRVTKGLLRKATAVRLAPSDTGGKKQGLLTFLENKQLDPELEAMAESLDVADGALLEKLAGLEMGKLPDVRDKHYGIAIASELTSLLGDNQNEILEFLIQMWDGDDYEYQLSKTSQTLQGGLLSIIGGTTPSSLAASLPQNASGGGFMSRFILCFGNTKYKSVPWPKPFDEDLEQQLVGVMSGLHYDFEGPFIVPRKTEELIREVYDESPQIDDARFVHYADRRQTHLLKLAMCLAAARQSHTIEVEDFREARMLLIAMEAYMSDALGEYGMNKLANAKQRLIETLRHARIPVDMSVLYATLQRDMNKIEFGQCVNELITANKIMAVKTSKGQALVYKDNKAALMEELMEQMAEEIEAEMEPEFPENIIKLKG